MDVDDTDSEASSIGTTILELAVHPMSSTNPPPRDLPDLLDRLITSEAELSRKQAACGLLIEKLTKRLINLRQRLEALREGHPSFRIDLRQPNKITRKSKQRMCFEAAEELYQRMFMQMNFVHTVLTRRLKVVIEEHMKAHKDVFDALLGERHDHPGIEVANSRIPQCALGCNWYFEHGPYEWTKRPYTIQWQQEMNHTDWDWFRMRKHIDDTIANARGQVILPADMLFKNMRRYVPFWFWYEQFETWSPWIEVLPVEGERGVVEEKAVCQRSGTTRLSL